MNAAYLSAFSALFGSVVGGLISGISSWASQRVQAKSALLGQEKLRHQELYREFIDQASRVYADGLLHNEPQISDLVPLYALVSRMRVLSSPAVVECADRVARTVVDSYFLPNKTLPEIRDIIEQGQALDVLKSFSEVAREELRSMGAP